MHTCREETKMNANKALSVVAFCMLTGAPLAQAATLIHHYDFSSGVTDSAGSANGTLVGDASTAGGVHARWRW
jgi:hypothetical protein